MDLQINDAFVLHLFKILWYNTSFNRIRSFKLIRLTLEAGRIFVWKMSIYAQSKQYTIDISPDKTCLKNIHFHNFLKTE